MQQPNQQQPEAAQPLALLAKCDSPVNAVAFSPNGRRVAVGLENGTIELWDLLTREKWATFRHDAGVRSVALSQDGKTLLSGSEDGTVRLWDVDNPSSAKATFRHDAGVTSVALSQDGNTLLSGSDDNTVRLWDVDNPSSAKAIFRHDKAVWSVALSQDGKTLLSGSLDITVRLWDVDNPSSAKATFRHDDYAVTSVALSQDGKILLSGSLDNTVRLWDVDNPSSAKATFRHDKAVWSVALSQDGKTLLSGSDDDMVHLWDVDNPSSAKATFPHDARVTSVALSQDGNTLLSGSSNRMVRLWDVDNPSSAKATFPHDKAVWSVALSQDGKTLLSGSEDDMVHLWDVDNPSSAKATFPHDARVTSVALSQDGNTLLSGSSNRMVRLWDVDNPSSAKATFPHDKAVWSVALSQDGKTLLSGSDDDMVRLWDVDNPSSAKATFPHDAGVTSVALSEDGNTLLSGSSDSMVRLWDVDNPSSAKATFRHDKAVWSVALSQGGNTLLSGSDDETVRLWDVDNPSSAKATFRHDAWVRSVALSQDGNTLLSGSFDNTVRLWDLTDPQYKRSLLIGTHPGQVHSVAFDPNGDYIFSAGENGIRVWRWKQFEVQRIPQAFQNDQPGDEDQLAIEKELRALADVLMMRSLEPPLAVAILGGWGSGKSFGMNLIKKHITNIRCRALTEAQTWAESADDPKLSPYVGHIYQIKFDAWTYAKSDLWASLMQTIFFELNRQLTLEKQLAKIGSMRQRQALEDKLEQLREQLTSPSSAAQQPQEEAKAQPQAIPDVPPESQLVPKTPQEAASGSEVLFPQQLSDAQIKQFEKILTAGKLTLNEENSDELRQDSEVEKVKKFLKKLGEDEQAALIELAKQIQPAESNFLLEEQNQDFWQILNTLNDAERTALIDRLVSSKLSPEEIQKWRETGGKGNSLWEILGELKKEEQETLKATEQELETLKQQKLQLEKQLQQETEKIERKRDRDNENLALIKVFVNRLHQELQDKPESSIFRDLSAELGLETPKDLDKLNCELSKDTADLEQLLEKHSEQIKPLIENANKIKSLLEDKPRRKLIGLIEFTQKNKKILLVFCLWLALPLLVYALFSLLPVFFPTLRLHEWVAQLFSSIKVGLVALVSIPGLNEALEILKKVTVWQAKINREFQAFQENVEAERQQLAAVRPEKDQAQIAALQKLQAQLNTTQSEITKLEIRAEAQRRQAGLTVQYGSLLEFVSDRLEEDSYQKRLGLMHQIKRDLEDLSDRLTCDLKHANPDRLKSLQTHFPRGSARVVLYIDDLDRCPPKRVIQVLEAVQLLLTTKLFIVIMAVDDRYVNRALESTYRGILKRRGNPSGVDYLEKIIQIPYRMRAISEKATLERYLRSQLAIEEKVKQSVVEPKAKGQTILDETSEVAALPQTTAQLEIEKTPTPPEKRDDALNERSQDPPAKSAEPIPPTNSNSTGGFIEIAKFDEQEFQTILDCCQYVDLTPRTTKRIINLCKILKLVWTSDGPKDSRWQQEPSLEVRQTVIAFLSLSGRYPNQIRCVLEELNDQFEDAQLESNHDNSKQLSFPKEDLLYKAKWRYPLKDSYMEREWTKFAKDVKQVLPGGKTETERENASFCLEQRTFNLLLSFCFIGDVGYDPDDLHPTSPPNNKESGAQQETNGSSSAILGDHLDPG